MSKDSWHNIDMQQLIRWLVEEGLIRATIGKTKRNVFVLTPKGYFLLKVMGEIDGGRDKEFRKMLDSFNYSFLRGKK